MMKLFSHWKRKKITDASPRRRPSKLLSKKSAKQNALPSLTHTAPKKEKSFLELCRKSNGVMSMLTSIEPPASCRPKNKFPENITPADSASGLMSTQWKTHREVLICVCPARIRNL